LIPTTSDDDDDDDLDFTPDADDEGGGNGATRGEDEMLIETFVEWVREVTGNVTLV
jgi:hypothetical protein